MSDRMRREPNRQEPSSRPPPPHKTERDPRRQGVYPLILPGAVFQNLQKLLRSGERGAKATDEEQAPPSGARDDQLEDTEILAELRRELDSPFAPQKFRQSENAPTRTPHE